MIKKGVYAATLSVLNENLSLNVEETISCENIIKKGLRGFSCFTGQSQLISRRGELV